MWRWACFSTQRERERVQYKTVQQNMPPQGRCVTCKPILGGCRHCESGRMRGVEFPQYISPPRPPPPPPTRLPIAPAPSPGPRPLGPGPRRSSVSECGQRGSAFPKLQQECKHADDATAKCSFTQCRWPGL